MKEFVELLFIILSILYFFLLSAAPLAFTSIKLDYVGGSAAAAAPLI